MRINYGRPAGPTSVGSAVLGLMLLGVAAAPAHAETVRDRQWHLNAMEADAAWKLSTGSGVTVAVIDSGVDDRVPDLRGQVLKGIDLSRLPGDENNDVGNHGTGMAALIAATGQRGPDLGSFGLAPGAKILPVRIPYATERLKQDAKGLTFAGEMSKAIRQAADSEARIISISVARSRSDSPELTAAVKYALGKNKLIFAAVGNEGAGRNEIEYPAGTPGVVGVGGLDQKAARMSVSEWGPQVDISAPGEDLTSACSGSTQVCRSTGTSGATALTSAAAALIWSKHPDWTNNQVLRVMLNTASGVKGGARHNEQVGYGAVRPLLALTGPGDPGPAGEYPLPDLAAAAAGSPSPVAAASGEPQSAGTSPEAADASGGGGNGLWVTLGIGAAALLAALAAIPLVSSRRRTAPAEPPAAPYPPEPQYPSPLPQQPHYGPPQAPHTPKATPHGGPPPGTGLRS